MKLDDLYRNWDYFHYETVFILVLEDDNVDPEEVAYPILKALCEIGVFKPGDKYKIAKCGNTIVVGKAHLYLELDSLDSVN